MKVAIFATVVALFGAVSAAPTPRQESHIARRDVNVIGLRHVAVRGLPTYAGIKYTEKRDDHRVKPKIINREPQIPADVPTKSDGKGGVTFYAKRQGTSVEDAVKTDDNGNIIPYVKRQTSVEDAVKTDDNGNIVPYVKRQTSVEDAVKTDDNGNIIPYVKRQTSVEDAVKTDDNGNIIPYVKRQIEEEIPTRSNGNGDIVEY